MGLFYILICFHYQKRESHFFNVVIFLIMPIKSYICNYVLSMSSSQSTESTKWYTLYTYFVMIFDIFIFFCTDVQFQIDLMFLILVNHVLIKRFFVHIVWNSMVYKFNFVTLYLLLCIIVQVYKIFFFKALYLYFDIR